jgi:hypothetical protein
MSLLILYSSFNGCRADYYIIFNILTDGLKSSFTFVWSRRTKHIDMCAERDSDTYICVSTAKQ